MKINRHIENELLRWKDSEYRKPLMLRGARQVGKTFYLHSLPFYFLPRLDEVITQLTSKYK